MVPVPRVTRILIGYLLGKLVKASVSNGIITRDVRMRTVTAWLDLSETSVRSSSLSPSRLEWKTTPPDITGQQDTVKVGPH